MITLTDTDVVRLLRKNNLNSDTLQENVVAKLREKGVKLATAESCTGGLLSERITAVSGASEVFDFGVCTYANEMKHKVLGVSNETLSVLGAVSAETAMQMAEGAHVGWDTVGRLRSPLFDGLGEGTYLYYVHSYAAQACDATIAQTDYGGIFSAALGRGNFFGTQFHPEKSGRAGERILRNFLKL